MTSSKIAELNQVSKSYGATKALDNVTFNIYAGEVVALLGPNGAGKTTAINLLLGLLQPTSGEVRLFGKNPKDAANRTRVGVMLQLSGLPETLKVKEHLELYRAYYPNPLPLEELVTTAGLVGLEDKLYGKLSGGQKQRLHLALALCGNPDLVFLDEPTTGLDVTSRRALWEQVRGFIGTGRTVVLTTHYLEEADALADRIAVLRQGQIVADGTPSEIKARTSGQRVRLVTGLEPSFVETLAGVTSVKRDGAALEVLTTQAESVVLSLLQRDPTARGLEVTNTGLEDAFLALTQEHQKAKSS
jgi:ABC-2 type transport system ATP-binding protein